LSVAEVTFGKGDEKNLQKYYLFGKHDRRIVNTAF